MTANLPSFTNEISVFLLDQYSHEPDQKSLFHHTYWTQGCTYRAHGNQLSSPSLLHPLLHYCKMHVLCKFYSLSQSLCPPFTDLNLLVQVHLSIYITIHHQFILEGLVDIWLCQKQVSANPLPSQVELLLFLSF